MAEFDRICGFGVEPNIPSFFLFRAFGCQSSRSGCIESELQIGAPPLRTLTAQTPKCSNKIFGTILLTDKQAKLWLNCARSVLLKIEKALVTTENPSVQNFASSQIVW